MNLEEAYAWIGSLRRFGIKPGLSRVRRVLSTLSNPEEHLRFYHVAGTNGKGSVCTMLAVMLRQTGLRVGVYTSPGLFGFNGRMTIDGNAISDDDFAAYASVVRQAVEQTAMEESLTEFEVLTVMSLLYFRDAKVEAVVWETGLGGRYDATSVVQPLVTAITNVSYDHVEILGPRLVDIAFEKAGIIKPGVPVVTGATGEAYRIIEQVAAQVGAPVIHIGREVSLTRTRFDEHSQTGFYRGVFRDMGNVKLSLFGRHQLTNAAIALAMFESQPLHISQHMWNKAVRSLATVRWPMRFEVFASVNGPVVLDAAHNPDAARKLASALDEFDAARNQQGHGWRMVIGIFADKDALPMLQAMLPRAREVIVCRPNHPRGASPDAIAKLVSQVNPGLPIRVIPDVLTATTTAAADTNALVIWGCLHMVEDARKAISKLEMNYWT